MCKTFLQRVLSALWRRKSGALIVVTSLTVLLLFFQYHNVQREGSDGGMAMKVSQRELRGYDARKHNNTSLFGEIKGEEAKGEVREEKVPADEMVANSAHLLNNNDVNDNNNVNNNNNDNSIHNIDNSVNNNDNSVNNNGEAGVEQKAEAVVIANSNPIAKSFSGVEGINSVLLSPKNSLVPNLNGQNGDGNLVSGGATPSVYIPKRRLFHLDLKGAPPKVEYLKKIFPLVKQLGANGVLLEYEDMFPYEGELAPMAATNHYSKEEVADILQLCRENEFEVIPLIQTFGHVEFILKLKPYTALREVPSVPQAFCPSNNDTMLLIQEMVDQMMALHPGVKFLHIGCDEVYQLGLCSKCSQRNMDEGRDALFISHVARVATYVRTRYEVIPIIWDDMLHHFTTENLKRYDLGKLVEPMVWTYVSDVYRFIPHETWIMYGEVFPYIWSASAFKGAFGEALVAPPVKTHLENNLAWLDVMSREQYRFKEFRGIAVTGWQRYDHFATLCELLPAAIPSLAVNMIAVSHGYFNESLRQQLFDALGCMRSPKYSTFVNFDVDPYLWDKMSWCFFPGVTFFKVTERLENVKKMVKDFISDEIDKKAWLNEYNVRHNYSNVPRIEAAMQNFPFIFTDVETLLRHARDTLREVFDENTVSEWIELKVYPLLAEMERIRKSAESLKAVDKWVARQLPPIPELAKYGVGVPNDAKQEKK